MEVEQIRAEVAALREALDHRDAQLATLDARVTSVSTELANQLTELGHELDGLDGLHRVDELHDGQVRLAKEQARYQLAFREDLALLAETVQRAR